MAFGDERIDLKEAAVRHASIINTLYQSMLEELGCSHRENLKTTLEDLRTRVQRMPYFIINDGLLSTLSFYLSKTRLGCGFFYSMILAFKKSLEQNHSACPDLVKDVCESLVFIDKKEYCKGSDKDYMLALALVFSVLSHYGRLQVTGDPRQDSRQVLEYLRSLSNPGRALADSQILLSYLQHLRMLVESIVMQE